MTDAAPLPSPLLFPIFGSAAVAEIFSDRAMLQAMLDFEAALASAEAEAGVIPAEAVAPIEAAAKAEFYDIAAIGQDAALGGTVAIPLVKALTAKVRESARGYVHWGATSQDVVDTATMLMARQALQAMRREIAGAMQAAIRLAETHRNTLMPGRTLLQQALPINFAFKAAGWLSGLTATAARLRVVESEGLALQFGGAVGTLAALGSDGMNVRHLLAARLKLAEPAISWHAERSRIFDLGAALVGASGACSKIATDLALLMQPEVGEVSEPAAAGKGGSSTMPHKRNPVGAASVRANHRRAVGLIATLAMSLEAEHERAPGGWAAEWETLRDLFILSAGSVERTREMLSGLEVDPAAMRDNLDAALGLPLAESLMMALAAKIGRGEAHHRIEAASKLALSRQLPLGEIAKAEPAIAGNLTAEEIDRALNPAQYLGSAESMIGAAIMGAEREMEKS